MSEYLVNHYNKPFKRVTCPIMQSYLTGLFDTRIKFFIWKSKNAEVQNWTCAATFTTTDHRAIDFLDSQFRMVGLSYKEEKRPTYWRQTSDKAKSFCCSWRANGLLLDHIIEIMTPHARFSKEMLAVIRDFRSLMRDVPRVNGRVPQEVVEERMKVYEKFLALERKYVKPIPRAT